jgi:uncharacterized membrane protein
VNFFALLALIIAVLAWRQATKVKSLEQRIRRLEEAVRRLRPDVTETAAEAEELPERGAVEPAPLRPPVAEPPFAASDTREEPSGVLLREPPGVETDRSYGTAASEPPAASPQAPSPGIDWESWLGVRGAAVLGGAVLALAGLFFFRYSIEHGLLPPWLRVFLGTVVGIGCVAASEWGLRVRYPGTANAVAGGGIAVLYAAFWAARALYGLIGIEFAFVLLVLTTSTCCVISWRHASLVVALLGLVGGFLTPLMLASDADRPIGLFSYVLLLDGGLLYLARRRAWPLLSVLSLAATFLYQVVWIMTWMGPDRLLLGLGILAVFAAVFAVAGGLAPEEQKGQWLISRAGAVLLPFAFAVYFAGNSRLGVHLFPVALLLLLLSVAAGWVASTERRPWIVLGAAAGDVGVVGVWLFARSFTAGLAWEAAGICVLLAAAFHLLVELDREAADWEGPAPAALVAAFGFLFFLTVAALRADGVPPWPWVAGWLGLAALLTRQATFADQERLAPIIGAVLAAALSSWLITHVRQPVFPGPALYLGTMLVAAVAFQVVAMVRRTAGGASAEWAAALFPIVVLVFLVNEAVLHAIPPGWLLPTALMLGGLSGLAATRLGDGRWLLAAMVVTVLVHSAWTFEIARPSLTGTSVQVPLLIQAAAVLLFTGWPFVAGARLQSDRWAWYAAALAGPTWFLSLRRLFERSFGDSLIAVLPIALGAVALLSAARARDLWASADPLRTSTLAWFLAVALGFVTVAIPLQLEKEWITIGWALEGLAVTLLWKRLDHPGLKYFGLALFIGVIVRLVANQAVLGYYPRSGWRIVNWLLYTYLVPAVALLWTSRILGESELSRARAWEAPVYERGWPVGGIITGLGGLIVIFVWINLAIAEWFATGATLHLRFERLPARDLTTSIAWAVYALVLLAAGVRRTSRGLRWLSLGLMMITVVKVFLYDLGELRDLYRVASLLGLAVSLILISLAYQRFVLRDRVREE